MAADCPRCASRLLEKRFGAVLIDNCTTCGGMWFDYEELSILAKDPTVCLKAIDDSFKPALASVEPHGDMKCPRCTLALVPFSFGHSPEVALDACPHCRGVWLDEGELSQIADKLSSADDREGQSDSERQREQVRMTSSYLMHIPCSACGQSNPTSSLVCWACGMPLHTTGSHLLCPRCDRPMLTTESGAEALLVEGCITCHGLYFGKGELDRVLEAGLEIIQLLRLNVGDGLGAYVGRGVNEELLARCPNCHIAMDRTPLGKGNAVLIDVCKKCGGTWLDAGELISAYEKLTIDESEVPTLRLNPLPMAEGVGK
ncbi:MAG: zf-TFIIB domain-containing protein [Chthonomonadales bacterium]